MALNRAQGATVAGFRDSVFRFRARVRRKNLGFKVCIELRYLTNSILVV